MISNSIRWNLQMWLAFLLICLLSSFGVAVYQLQRQNRFRALDQELEQRLALLSGDVRTSPLPQFIGKPIRGPHGHGFRGPGGPGGQKGPPPDKFEDRPPPQPFGERPPWDDGPNGPPPPGFMEEFREEPQMSREIRVSPGTAGLFKEDDTNLFYYAVWNPTGGVLKNSTNCPAPLERPSLTGDTSTHIQTRGAAREAYLFTTFNECILVGKSIEGEQLALRRFAWLIFAAGGAILLLGLGVGWGLTVRALRPIEEISAAATRISGGRLSERIHTTHPENEIGRLAAVLNSTFSRLEQAFAQQREFTANASHELRTPLAVIISEAQTTLARERSSAEYRETIEVCLDAAKQMSNLARSLLELARYDAGQEVLNPSAFDLSENVCNCVSMIELLARERHIEIKTELAKTPVFADPDRITQVIINLLSNAIYYNQDHGQIRIVTKIQDGRAALIVSDTGCGISPEDLPHVFGRFYRADKARARSQGHSGLGLAICKTIVEAHGGSIAITSTLGAGTTFTVQLPAK